MKPNHLIDPNELIVCGSITASHIPSGSMLAIRLPTKGLDIGRAVAALERGERVRRAGWNGKGMHLELQVPDAHSKMSLPYVFMFTACKNRVPWLCSQTDLLARDWEIVEDGQIAEPVDPNHITSGPIAAYAREAISEIEWELAK